MIQMNRQDKQETINQQQYQQKMMEWNREKEELEKMYHEKLKKYVVECFLKQQGAKNTKALLALIDLENIILNDDNTLEGLDIKQLKKDVPYLFEEQNENKKIEGTGYQSTNKKVDKKSDIAKQFEQALMRR